MKTLLRLLPLMVLLCLGGCRQPADPSADSTEIAIAFADTVALPVQPATDAVKAHKNQPRPAARPRPKTTPSPSAKPIYVETDGAQGRVWGHITMQGDHGTGTIHDWDENTLAVSVTRHGNELLAVDQNSRQYVFRLKQ